MSNSNSTLDQDLELSLEGVDELALMDFVNKRLAQTLAAVMLLESDFHLEGEGGSASTLPTRLDAVWGIKEGIQATQAAMNAFNRSQRPRRARDAKAGSEIH